MLNEWHWAAQYLATAAKSFIPAKEDDSHTNLGYDHENALLYTHPMSEEEQVLFSGPIEGLALPQTSDECRASPSIGPEKRNTATEYQ